MKVVSAQERYEDDLTLENKKSEFEAITLFRRRRVVKASDGGEVCSGKLENNMNQIFSERVFYTFTLTFSHLSR